MILFSRETYEPPLVSTRAYDILCVFSEATVSRSFPLCLSSYLSFSLSFPRRDSRVPRNFTRGAATPFLYFTRARTKLGRSLFRRRSFRFFPTDARVSRAIWLSFLLFLARSLCRGCISSSPVSFRSSHVPSPTDCLFPLYLVLYQLEKERERERMRRGIQSIIPERRGAELLFLRVKTSERDSGRTVKHTEITVIYTCQIIPYVNKYDARMARSRSPSNERAKGGA